MAPGVIWLFLAGPVWSALGAMFLPHRYRTQRGDPRLAGLAGGLWGAALGPFALAPLYAVVPLLRRGLHVVLPAVLVSGELLLLFADDNPGNLCVTDPLYVLNQ